MRPDLADLRYSERHIRNVLDLYLPAARPAPLVLWIHGGAFREGDKAAFFATERLVAEGFAVASLNYRLSGDAIWPAQLEDVQAALGFLRENGADWGADSSRIAVWGASAGGFLAALAGIVEPVAAVVDWYGPVLFTEMDSDMAASGVARASPPNSAAGSPESELIGAVVGENPALAASVSPLAFLRPGQKLPPFLIMHGARDNLIAAKQSERLHLALGAVSELLILPGGTHGGGDFRQPEALDAVLAFLRRHLVAAQD